jgi:hypothetical protein
VKAMNKKSFPRFPSLSLGEPEYKFDINFEMKATKMGESSKMPKITYLHYKFTRKNTSFSHSLFII